MGKAVVAFIVSLFVFSIIWDDDNQAKEPPVDHAEQQRQAEAALAALDEAENDDETISSSTSDEATPPPPPAPPPSPWKVSRWQSKMDDSPAVLLTSESEEMVSGRFGRAGPATLMLRCLENTTNLLVKVNDHFLADIQSYGNVRYRIDDRQAATLRMRESTDNEALGLWSGGQAIPVIRRMFGHDQVTMQITPFNQSSVTVTFPITGLQESIAPLRQACHW